MDVTVWSLPSLVADVGGPRTGVDVSKFVPNLCVSGSMEYIRPPLQCCSCLSVEGSEMEM